MRLTTKGRYAVTAVLDLAIHQENGPVSLAAISERQSISLSYLEQLFSKLRRNGVVTSTRGPGGGYTLQRAATETTVSDVIIAIDETHQVASCESTDSCQGDYQCLTHDLWQEISSEIRDFLDGISIADVMSGKVESEMISPDLTVHQDKAVVNL